MVFRIIGQRDYKQNSVILLDTTYHAYHHFLIPQFAFCLTVGVDKNSVHIMKMCTIYMTNFWRQETVYVHCIACIVVITPMLNMERESKCVLCNIMVQLCTGNAFIQQTLPKLEKIIFSQKIPMLIISWFQHTYIVTVIGSEHHVLITHS